MSQQEIQQLMERWERNERENREIVEKLKAHSQISPAIPGFAPTASNYQTPLSSRSSIGNNARSRSNTAPRNAAPSFGPQLRPAQQDQSRPMKRSKTTHAPASSTTAPMMRSSSSITTAGSKTDPFLPKAPALPIPPVAQPNAMPVAGPGLLSGYLSQAQFQQSTHVFAGTETFLPSQSQIGSLGQEMNVDDFLLMREQAFVHDQPEFISTLPISIPPALLSSPQESTLYHSSSIPSACGSMTSGPTLETAPMSRCNSTMNDNASISGQFNEMVRIQSQQSARSQLHPGSLGNSQPPMLGKRSSNASDLLAMRADQYSSLAQHHHPMESSASQSSFVSTSSAARSPRYDLNSPLLAQHLTMERSASKDSVKSNSSLQHRAKEALARQNGNAARLIQPKPAAELKAEATGSANSGGKVKAAISKTKYERPKHPKVLCNQCNEHPEGFRGEHELRRHTEAKHKSLVKKWICRDPQLVDIAHSERPVKALKDCKQCSSMKEYGAYYNAAAHLRRTHFKVKPKKGASGSKNGSGGKGDEEKEKRGGKGGGDWPSMSELKLWMFEMMVPMDKAGALVPDSNESVDAVEPEDDFESEMADTQYHSSTQQSNLCVSTGEDEFDMAAFVGVGGGFTEELDVSGGSFQNVQGGLESQLAEMHRVSSMFPTPSLPGIPISSAGFDYRSPDLRMQQPNNNMAPASMVGFKSQGYMSPVSSATTITPVGAFSGHMHHDHTVAGVQDARDDLPDLPFDLTFTSGGQQLTAG